MVVGKWNNFFATLLLYLFRFLSICFIFFCFIYITIYNITNTINITFLFTDEVSRVQLLNFYLKMTLHSLIQQMNPKKIKNIYLFIIN